MIMAASLGISITGFQRYGRLTRETLVVIALGVL